MFCRHIHCLCRIDVCIDRDIAHSISFTSCCFLFCFVVYLTTYLSRSSLLLSFSCRVNVLFHFFFCFIAHFTFTGSFQRFIHESQSNFCIQNEHLYLKFDIIFYQLAFNQNLIDSVRLRSKKKLYQIMSITEHGF